MSMMCGFIIMNFWVKSWRIKYCWRSIWYFKITDSDQILITDYNMYHLKKISHSHFISVGFVNAQIQRTGNHPTPFDTVLILNWKLYFIEFFAAFLLAAVVFVCTAAFMPPPPPFVWFSTYFDWCFYIASDTVINSGFHKVLFSSHKWWNFLEEKDILVKRNLSRDDERFGYIQCSAREWYALIE